MFSLTGNSSLVFGASRSRKERLEGVNHEKLDAEETNGANWHESKNQFRADP